jgi:hypothetical protein
MVNCKINILKGPRVERGVWGGVGVENIHI